MMSFVFFVVQIWSLTVQAVTPSPSVGPSFAPTPIPATVQQLPLSADPIAKHQLVVVPPGGDKVIQLTFFDPATTKVRSSHFINIRS